MNNRSTHSLPCVALSLLVGALNPNALAAEPKDAPYPAGAWKWTVETQSGQTIESTLKLKQEGDKLSGTFIGRGGTEVAIQDAKLKDNAITFTVVRERDGQKMVSKYAGKLSGDTIKGKIETERDGQTRSRDWEAKRESATGTWHWSFEIPNGPTLEPSAKLRQEGDKLTGVLIMGERERPVSEGTLKDGEVKFKVVSQRDDRTVTSNYRGKLSGDTIKGQWDSDWSGEVVTRDWEAKRTKE